MELVATRDRIKALLTEAPDLLAGVAEGCRAHAKMDAAGQALLESTAVALLH